MQVTKRFREWQIFRGKQSFISVFLLTVTSFLTTAHEIVKNEFDNVSSEIDYVEYNEPRIFAQPPEIKILNEYVLEAGMELNAVCMSKHSSSPAQNLWFLDDEMIESALEFEDVNVFGNESTLYSFIQLNITADDDGKKLMCQSFHSGHKVESFEDSLKLSVVYKPLKLPIIFINGYEVGKSFDVTINFRSNPKPSTLKWIVDNRKIYYGTKANKCQSIEITSLGNNNWRAVLQISNLTHADTLLNYTLQVRNSLGGTEYQVKFSDASEMTSHETNEKENEEDFEIIDGTTFSDTRSSLEINEMLDVTETDLLSTEHISTTTATDVNIPLIQLETSTIQIVDSSQPQPMGTELPKVVIDVTTFLPETEESQIFTEKYNHNITMKLPTEDSFPRNELNEFITPEMSTDVPSRSFTSLSQSHPTKGKISKVVIIKRPFNFTSLDSTTESMITIHQTNKIDELELFLSGIVVKVIVSWKTSLMILLFFLLLALISYHFRRIRKLKAELIQKNLESAVNQSSSSRSNRNAYTPAYFPRRNILSSSKFHDSINSRDTECDSDMISHSECCYSHTYNPSLHLYESIDEFSNSISGCHIYAEIPSRQDSIVSIETDFNHNHEFQQENNIDSLEHSLEYAEAFDTTTSIYYQALIVAVSESDLRKSELESTYI
ncbi:CLUMA_CG016381, isoform A [Clunio marinus]|uniref:CLUMA_CG016381, isoform A n=1 Tax=Clunio marinus TaxID=568069 RepID=A0A1J1ISC4_9DIPT|nr:CLUMA_CG016381, isoform A [Clunio marinus]